MHLNETVTSAMRQRLISSNICLDRQSFSTPRLLLAFGTFGPEDPASPLGVRTQQKLGGTRPPHPYRLLRPWIVSFVQILLFRGPMTFKYHR